jgi:hypothetical protein
MGGNVSTYPVSKNQYWSDSVVDQIGVMRQRGLVATFRDFYLRMNAEKKMSDETVRNNAAKSRFELEIDGSLALAEYVLSDGVMVFTHTESPPALQGRGAASRLIHGALLQARDQGLKVRATCSFVVAYLKRHPEFADIEA